MGIFSSGDLEWSGTVQETEQNHTLYDYLEINQRFALTMVVTPCAVIAGIVIWDKRKRRP